MCERCLFSYFYTDNGNTSFDALPISRIADKHDLTQEIFNLQKSDENQLHQLFITIYLNLKNCFDLLLLNNKKLAENEEIKINDVPLSFKQTFLQILCEMGGTELHLAVLKGNLAKVISMVEKNKGSLEDKVTAVSFKLTLYIKCQHFL